MISVPLARSLSRIVLHHSLSPTVSFTFATPYLTRAVSSLSSISKLFLASPFVLSSFSPSRDFICPSSSSYLRARLFARSLRTVSHLSIQSLCLSSPHNRTSIRHSSLFFRFSSQSLRQEPRRNRQTFQRFALHCTPVRRRVIVKRLYSLD